MRSVQFSVLQWLSSNLAQYTISSKHRNARPHFQKSTHHDGEVIVTKHTTGKRYHHETAQFLLVVSIYRLEISSSKVE
jgi:hypothetical protein